MGLALAHWLGWVLLSALFRSTGMPSPVAGPLARARLAQSVAAIASAAIAIIVRIRFILSPEPGSALIA